MASIELHGLRVYEVRSELENCFNQYHSWLDKTLVNQRGTQDLLEIIVGAGNHSKNNIQILRPEVERILQQWKEDRKYKLAEATSSIEVLNKGCLLGIFSRYRGKVKCGPAQFYCNRCDKMWYSKKALPTHSQKCNGCKSRCKPLKFGKPFKSSRR